MPGSVISLFLVLRVAQSMGVGAVWWSFTNRTSMPNDGFFSALDSSTLANASQAVDAAQVGYFVLMSFFLGEVFSTFGEWMRTAYFDQPSSSFDLAARFSTSDIVGFEYQWLILKLRMFASGAIAGIAYIAGLYEGYGFRTLADLGWYALNALLFAAFCFFTAHRLGEGLGKKT